MVKTRPPNPAAFREQIIELFRSGRSQSELAREFSITPATIANWVARAAADNGAAAVTVANSYPGVVMGPDHRPVLGNTVGGVSGPSIRPLTMRLLWEVVDAVDIPVIGCGGITTADDARDYLELGAAAVQVGTATFSNPAAMHQIARALPGYGDREGTGAPQRSKEHVA